MPEMSNDDIVTLQRYRAFGTVDQVGKKIDDLEKDNSQQRRQIEGLQAKVPKDDEIVVKKVDADELGKWRELGKKPSDIKGALDKGEKAAVDLAVREQRDAASKFAKAVGLADESVDTLIALPALQGALFETKKGKVKDPRTNLEKDGEVGYLTLAGEKQKPMTFAEATEQIPALKGLRTAGPPQKVDADGVTFVSQNGDTGSQGGGTIYDEIRNRAKEKPKDDKATEPTGSVVEKRLGMLR